VAIEGGEKRSRGREVLDQRSANLVRALWQGVQALGREVPVVYQDVRKLIRKIKAGSCPAQRGSIGCPNARLVR